MPMINGIQHEYRSYIPRFDADGNSLPGLFVPGFLVPSAKQPPKKKTHGEPPTCRKCTADVIEMQTESDGENTVRMVESALEKHSQIPTLFGRWTMQRVIRHFTQHDVRGPLPCYKVDALCKCGRSKRFNLSEWRRKVSKQCVRCSRTLRKTSYNAINARAMAKRPSKAA